MKKVIVLLMVVILLLSFIGCSSNGGKDDDMKTTGTNEKLNEGTKEQEGQKENVELRFMWWGSDSRHKATLEAISMFEESHPGIKINGEYGGYDGYFEKLTTQLSGGTAADIIQIHPAWPTDLYKIGDVFVDLYKTDKVDLSGFDKEFLSNFCTYKDQLVGLPTGINAANFLINTAVTDAAGIDIKEPYTWEKLIKDARRLREYNPNQYMVNYDITTLGKEFIWGYIAQLTGNELVLKDNTLGFTRDDLYKTFEMIDRLYKEEVFEPAADTAAFDNARNTNPKWISHDYAGLFGITSLTTGNYYDFKDTADVVLPPIMEGAKDPGLQLSPAQSMSVNADSKHVDNALEFLDYFFNSEDAARVLKDTRSIPPTENARRICEEENLVDSLSVKAVNLLLPIATNVQNLNLPSEIAAILKDATEKVAYSQGSLDSITDEAMEMMEEVLEKLRK